VDSLRLNLLMSVELKDNYTLLILHNIEECRHDRLQELS
jgi:hypothetical protein